MTPLVVPTPLRHRLGEEPSEGLVQLFGAYDQRAAARIDRRLEQMQYELHRELHDGMAGIRTEMANMRADLFKWMLAFWIGQFAALAAVLSFMLPAR